MTQHKFTSNTQCSLCAAFTTAQPISTPKPWLKPQNPSSQISAGTTSRNQKPHNSHPKPHFRMVLAQRPKAEPLVPYVGVAPSTKRGHLRVSFYDKFDPDYSSQRQLVEDNVERFRWARRTGGFTKGERYRATWLFLFRALSTNWWNEKNWTYWGGKTKEKVRGRRRGLAKWIREEVIRLGPTFIKVAQLFSSRSDLFPAEVVEELGLLQDKVPSFRFEDVKWIIENELGGRIEDVFSYFEQVPIAAASLGQVHYGVLMTGEQVAVKVQRPYLKELFDLDLDAFKSVAEYLQKSKKYGGRGRDWLGIYKECAEVLYDEIDYELEGRSAMEFAKDFKDVSWVRVPKVYFDYTTKKVLTMQYVPGIKITEKAKLLKAGINVKEVANRAGKAFLMQLLGSGLFNADPHPGNLAIAPGPSLIYYDFGMTKRIRPNIRENLVTCLLGVVQKNADQVMEALIDLGVLVTPADPVPVRRAIQYFLDNLQTRPTREQTVSTIGEDLYAVSYDKPFRFPATFTFVLRALITLEGINKFLDPEFKFSKVSQPYAEELINGRRGTNGTLATLFNALLSGRTRDVTSRFRKGLFEAGSGAIQAPDRIKRIESALTKLERGDIKLRARSTETERLLRRQLQLAQNSNYLVAAGVATVIGVQLYVTGWQNAAIGAGSISSLLWLAYLRATRKLSKVSIDNLDGDGRQR